MLDGHLRSLNLRNAILYDIFKLGKVERVLSYLIFVISFTQAKFSENEIYTEKRINYKKRISRQNSVNQDLLGQATKKCENYTLSVKAHLVCVKMKNTHKVFQIREDPAQEKHGSNGFGNGYFDD